MVDLLILDRMQKIFMVALQKIISDKARRILKSFLTNYF